MHLTVSIYCNHPIWLPHLSIYMVLSTQFWIPANYCSSFDLFIIIVPLVHALLYLSDIFVSSIEISKQAVCFLMTNLKCTLGVWAKYAFNKVKGARVSSLGFSDPQSKISTPSMFLIEGKTSMSDQPSGVNTTKLTQKDAHFSFNFIPTGYTTIRCIELENGDHAQDFFSF